MKLILASNNRHKLEEIRAILGDHFSDILSMAEAGIVHETVEDGKTFMENAVKKAREMAELSGCCALADDSGLCVDALDGGPGIYSARFPVCTAMMKRITICFSGSLKASPTKTAAPIIPALSRWSTRTERH